MIPDRNPFGKSLIREITEHVEEKKKHEAYENPRDLTDFTPAYNFPRLPKDEHEEQRDEDADYTAYDLKGEDI